MGNGTVAIQRETKRQLELLGAKVLSAEHVNSGHVHYTVQSPSGKVFKVVGAATPTDAWTSVRETIRKYKRTLRRV